MPQPPVTFPCPFCGKRMGVTAEFLGKQVRCPHCQKVLLAPAAPPQSPAPPPPAAPRPATPPSPVASQARTEPDLPPLNVPTQREGADSILGDPDEADDDAFGKKPGKIVTLPDVSPPPPPPTPAKPPSRESALERTEPMGMPPLSKVPAPQPAPKPTPGLEVTAVPGAPAPQPAPGGLSNPFAGFDAPAPAPAPAPVAEVLDDVPEPEPATRPGRGRRAPAGGSAGAKPLYLYLALGWAVLATALAVYGFAFRYGAKVDPGHPLSTIPDNFGEFDPAARKKVSALKLPADADLPGPMRAALGEKLAVGQLEIVPRKVEKRRLAIVTDRGTGDGKPEFVRPALVLTVWIKNTSPDLHIFPMDPAFTRRASTADQPLTRLVVGKQAFAGGYVAWPFPDRIKRRMEVQQANDYVPLRPGEDREYVVYTDDRPEILRAADAATEPIQWRVQVRSGLFDLVGTEVPVTSVIGVDFRATDIKQPG